MKNHNGFTLIEMLIVIGIIAILTGSSIVGYNKIVIQAEETRAKELLSNVATAMTAYYQTEHFWPKAILAGASGSNKLDEKAALPLAKKGYLSLTMNDEKTELSGLDKFGVVTPWATNVIKQRGKSSSKSTKVSGKFTVDDHTIMYAIDDDEDGFVEIPSTVGSKHGGGKRARATACVWCINKKGEILTSWTKGQVK